MKSRSEGAGKVDDDLVVGKKKLKTEEVLKEGWIYIGIGAENYFVKIADPKCPKWSDRAAVTDWINMKINLPGEIVAMEWPTKVYRQPQGIGLFPVMDSPADDTPSIYPENVFYFNMKQVTNWAFVDLLKVEAFVDYFRLFLEDIGGRIAVSQPGPLSGPQEMPGPSRR